MRYGIGDWAIFPGQLCPNCRQPTGSFLGFIVSFSFGPPISDPDDRYLVDPIGWPHNHPTQ